MVPEGFRSEMAEALEIDPAALTEEYVLEESELWDSMTFVTTIAMVDEFYGKSISGDDLKGCKTFGDIVKLASS